MAQLGQTAFRTRFEAVRLVVARAGMGTVLSTAEIAEPLIPVPGRAKFGGHRKDHRQDTTCEMAGLSSVTVVEDGEALRAALDLAMAPPIRTCRSCAWMR